jgi:peptide/nickel transport system substrate-binding protein
LTPIVSHFLFLAFMNNNFFTPRRILIVIAVLLAAWLVYPLVFGKKKVREPEEVYVRLDAAPANINVFLAGGHAPSSYLSRQIFQTLGDLDPKSLELKPLLLQSIPSARQVQDGPRKGQYAYDFAIIPEAVWDNGSPVTAHDVAFTLKVVLHPNLPSLFRGYLSQISGMDIDPADPKKFTVYLSSFYFLSLEALCSTPIFPAYQYDANNRLTNMPLADFLDTAKVKTLASSAGMEAFVKEFSEAKFANDPNAISGSGSYRLEIMNEQGAILVKKLNWWGDKVAEQYPMLRTYPKKLVYKVVKDDLAMENMLKSGELDLVGGSINPAKFLEWKATDSLAARYNFLTLGYTLYNRWMLNHKSPVLADPLVRKALTHIVDYDYLINQVQRGMAVRIAVPMPPNRPYYNKNLTPPDFNIAKAKELLAQAGWSDTDGDGFADKILNGKKQTLSFKLLAATSSKVNELTANSLKETCKQAGIDLQLVSADLSTMTADTQNGNYDSAILGVAIFPGQIEYYQRFHSKSLAPAGDNRSNYVSAEADRLIEAIRGELDVAKRNQDYLKIQEVLYNDLPEIPLFAPMQRIIVSNKFEQGIESENRPGYYEHFAKIKE